MLTHNRAAAAHRPNTKPLTANPHCTPHTDSCHPPLTSWVVAGTTPSSTHTRTRARMRMVGTRMVGTEGEAPPRTDPLNLPPTTPTHTCPR